MADLTEEDRKVWAQIQEAADAYRENAVLCDLASLARAAGESLDDSATLQHDLRFPLGVALKAR